MTDAGPHVDLVESGDGGSVEAVFEDIARTRAGELDETLNLSDLWRAYANAPHLLETFWPHMRDGYREGRLSFALKSKISLVTANVLDCEGCRVFHTTRLAEEGLDPDEIARLRAQEIDRSIFGEREHEILRFAETLATDHGAVGGEDIDRLRAAGLSDAEIVELVDTVAIHVHAAVVQSALGIVAEEIEFTALLE